MGGSFYLGDGERRGNGIITIVTTWQRRTETFLNRPKTPSLIYFLLSPPLWSTSGLLFFFSAVIAFVRTNQHIILSPGVVRHPCVRQLGCFSIWFFLQSSQFPMSVISFEEEIIVIDHLPSCGWLNVSASFRSVVGVLLKIYFRSTE